MMGGIKTAFRDETPRYDWVDEQTREKILQKVGSESSLNDHI